MAGFSMDDYVDVAERIQVFYKEYPKGFLTTGSPPQLMFVGEKTFIVYHAQAFRSADDPHPGDGWAWEPVPGPTQFTRDSELQNAETAAWGRAIVALGFATKKIASRQEVRNRQADSPARQTTNGASNGQPDVITDEKRRLLRKLQKELGVTDEQLKEIVQRVAGVGSSKEIPVDKYDALMAAVKAGASSFYAPTGADSDIPF